MRSFLTSVAELAGAALLVRGLGMAWEPLGYISGGGLLITLGVLGAVPKR